MDPAHTGLASTRHQGFTNHVCHRFSCAGLVIEAYRDAGIDVVRTEEEDLPPVSLAELKT